MAKEIVAMILAGGRGSRLYALTQKTAKPAVSFGGKYRIVDFPLSNCVNSNIDTVGIATQYQPQKLNEYIGNGQPWDLDRLHGGVHTLPPYEQAKGTDWYKGTANAIYQNISFIDSYDPEYVIILSGDQICKQDYADFLRFHKEKGAEFSVAVMEVDWKEASRFGLMVADENDRITEFQEKPPVPKSNLASMGIYIFNWDVLKKYLEEDEADPNSKNDFGMNIIPALLRDGRKITDMEMPLVGKIAMKEALKKIEEKTGLEIYNLGTGVGYSVLDIVKNFEAATGVKIPYVIKPRRAGDIATCYCDASKAEKELGWKAENGIREMCEDSWRWQSNNPQGYEE